MHSTTWHNLAQDQIVCLRQQAQRNARTRAARRARQPRRQPSKATARGLRAAIARRLLNVPGARTP